MEKTIYWDDGKKELEITTWTYLMNWVFILGVHPWFYNNVNAEALRWTAGVHIEFLCFGVSFEFYNWKTGDRKDD